MIGYLLDASALWQILRDDDQRATWEGHIAEGSFHICEPTRTEFLYSATSPAHRDELVDDLDLLCRSVNVPANAWRWVETAQYKLTQKGRHRSAGPVDLLLCATAVHLDMPILHLDDDFTAVGRALPEVREQRLRV